MVIAVDTETCLITPTCLTPPLVCVSWADDRGGEICHRDRAKPLIAALLEEELVGQNFAYDAGVMMVYDPSITKHLFRAYDENRVTDTRIRQRLIDIADGTLDDLIHRHNKSCYSLEALAWRHLRKPLDKDTWRLRYGELIDTPLSEWPAGARQYPIDDAVTTRRVWEAQESEARLLKDQYRQTRHALWLHLVSCQGIRTDPERVAALRASIEHDIIAAKDLLRAEGLLRADGTRDTKAAIARMKDLGATKTTASGRLSIDREACEAVDDEVMQAYADFSHLNKMLTVDVPALERGQIHGSFQSLMATGRTSCQGYNLQNPPRKYGVRECFVPRPGHVFVDADYDGLELRTMAQACLELVGLSTMADVLNAGEDPHIMLGARLAGVSYEEAKALYKADKRWEHRQFAKIGNFGLAGGMGITTLVNYAKNNGIIITKEKAQEIKQTWLTQWPEFNAYFQRAGYMTEEGPAVTEQLFSGRFRGGLNFSELCNTYFQGLGADAAKDAGWALTKACWLPGSVLYGSRIVNFIHDQFLIEVPEDRAHECACEVQRIMVEEANRWLPDVPATTTPCLARCWSKDAEAIYQNGRLIPWQESR